MLIIIFELSCNLFPHSLILCLDRCLVGRSTKQPTTIQSSITITMHVDDRIQTIVYTHIYHLLYSIQPTGINRIVAVWADVSHIGYRNADGCKPCVFHRFDQIFRNGRITPRCFTRYSVICCFQLISQIPACAHRRYKLALIQILKRSGCCLWFCLLTEWQYANRTNNHCQCQYMRQPFFCLVHKITFPFWNCLFFCTHSLEYAWFLIPIQIFSLFAFSPKHTFPNWRSSVPPFPYLHFFVWIAHNHIDNYSYIMNFLQYSFIFCSHFRHNAQRKHFRNYYENVFFVQNYKYLFTLFSIFSLFNLFCFNLFSLQSTFFSIFPIFPNCPQ